MNLLSQYTQTHISKESCFYKSNTFKLLDRGICVYSLYTLSCKRVKAAFSNVVCDGDVLKFLVF